MATNERTNDSPDYSKQEVDRLSRDYGELSNTVDTLVAKGEAIPPEIADDAMKGEVASLIKAMRDARTRIEGMHDLEAQPHYRRWQGANQYFFGLVDRLLKRDRKNNDGIGDILQRKLTAYDTKKLAEEQERRRQETARLAAIAAQQERERQESERIAREAREAAERARNPVKIEEKTQVAQVAAEAVIEKHGAAAVAQSAADDAYISSLAKPADIMRHRGSDGTLSTMGTEKYAEITNRVALLKSADKLWPYLSNEALEKAVRAYANSMGYSDDDSVQIEGAKFGKRAKSVVR